MSRNFPDFITAFQDYAKDDMAPDGYVLWAAISLIAAAMERKTWMITRGKIARPNLFILLVGPPGAGKSITVGKMRPIIDKFRTDVRGLQREFKVLYDLGTSAGMIENMQIATKEPDGSNYTSMYIVSPEGSESYLKNHGDDFRSTACAMYDCSESYEKTLQRGRYVFPQPVMNMLTATTFEFLSTVIDKNTIFGGLASRFTYVIDEKEIPEVSGVDEEGIPLSYETIDKLTEDLVKIHNLRGRFRFDQTARELHDVWWSDYRKVVKTTESERIRSLVVRKPLMLIKTMMVFSASESDDLIIKGHHVEKAIAAVEATTKDLARVITSAIMGDKTSQDGTNQFLMQTIKNHGGVCPVRVVKQKFITYGGDVSKYEGTVKMLVEAGMIEILGSNFKLLIEPNDHL